MLGLGESHAKASEFDRSRLVFQAAADLARTAGLGEHLARAALGLARGWVEQGTADPAVISLLEEALAALPDTATALRARLLGRLAMELHFSSQPQRCETLARQSVTLARQLRDPSSLAFALNARHWAQRGQDEVGELLEIADEIIRHAEASAELELALQGHSWRLVDLLELGQTEEIDDEIAACASLADRLHQPFYRSWVVGLQPMRALMQGRFDEAERLARDALAAAEAAGNWNGITASRVQLAWCWKDVGRGAERAAEVERFVQDEVLTRPLSRGATAMWNGNLALFMAEAGLEERALQYLARLSACGDAQLTQDVDGRSAAALGAEACALLRDEQLARRLYKQLRAARWPVHPRRPRRLFPRRGGALPRPPRFDARPRRRGDSTSRGRVADQQSRTVTALGRAQPARPRPRAADSQRTRRRTAGGRPAGARRAARTWAGDAIGRGAGGTRTLRDQRLSQPDRSA